MGNKNQDLTREGRVLGVYFRKIFALVLDLTNKELETQNMQSFQFLYHRRMHYSEEYRVARRTFLNNLKSLVAPPEYEQIKNVFGVV